MKNPSLKDWLIDIVVVVGMGSVAVFWLPLVAAWCIMFSSLLGRTSVSVHSIVLGDLLPHVLIGCFLGYVTAWFVRHQKVVVAISPSVILSTFYLFYNSLGPLPYPWSRSWLDVVLVADELLLIAASWMCAWYVLKRRQSKQSLQPKDVTSNS